MGNWTIAWRALAGMHRGARIPAVAAALVWCLPACALTSTDTVPTAAQVTIAQCDRSGVVAADVVAGTRFNASLPPFGDVCFLARRHLASELPAGAAITQFRLAGGSESGVPDQGIGSGRNLRRRGNDVPTEGED